MKIAVCDDDIAELNNICEILNNYFEEKKYRRIPKSQLFDRIIEDSFGCYPGYAGVMQQYIFNYERNVIGKNQA